jgi:hypothetical protein
MVIDKRWTAIGGLVAAAAAVGAWVLLQDPAPTPAPAAGAAEAPRSGGRREPDLPRIDLARLDRVRPDSGVGRRDLFDFATPPPTPPPPVPSFAPVVVATPPPITTPTPPPLGPLNIKYIGQFEGRRGLKVAVLMTDRREVLTAQAGQVVANRYRIVRIGIESVDVQEVGSDQVRRIPLKGN